MPTTAVQRGRRSHRPRQWCGGVELCWVVTQDPSGAHCHFEHHPGSLVTRQARLKPAALPNPSSALSSDHEHPTVRTQGPACAACWSKVWLHWLSAAAKDQSVLRRLAYVQPQRAQRRSALPQALLKARRATRGCHASSTAHSSSADARECATSTGVTNGAEAFFPNG